LRFLSALLRRKEKNERHTFHSFTHAPARLSGHIHEQIALESNELNGRNIFLLIKAKYGRERASREIARLDVVTRA